MTQTTRRLLLAGTGALALALAASPVSAQKKYDEGATDTEIKIGNTNPYSGNASAYGTIGKAIDAYFKMVNEQGGINGRKINFISYDDGYCAAEDGGDGAQAGRGGQGAVRLPDARHAAQHGDPEVPERQEGAAAVRRHRRLQVGSLQGDSRGRWASSPTTSPRPSSTPSTSWPTSRTPRSAS